MEHILFTAKSGVNWQYDPNNDILYEVTNGIFRHDGTLVLEDDKCFHFTKEENTLIFASTNDELAMIDSYSFMRCLRRRFNVLGMKVKAKKIEYNKITDAVHIETKRAYKITFNSDADYAFFILHYSQHCVK